jgi:hypothetical protein
MHEDEPAAALYIIEFLTQDPSPAIITVIAIMKADSDSARALHSRASDNLRYIRDAMERASAFTAVPGVGGMVMGLIGLAAAPLAARQADASDWVAIWLIAACAATATGAFAMWFKAKRAGVSVMTGSGRRFVLSFAVPLLVGGVLTVALLRVDGFDLLPAVWLLLYGTAVVSGGAFSVPVVPVMGACFLGVGLVAALFPVAGDICMAIGFGGLQIGFGILIARRHGG